MFMKNLLTFCVAVILFATSLFGKPYEPQVKGGFKTCSVYEIRFKNGKIDEKSRKIEYSQNYDKNGNITEMVYYNEGNIDGKIKIENKYNDKGLLIETKRFDPTETHFALNKYVYDSNNNLIADTSFSLNQQIQSIGISKYDKNNFQISQTYEVKVENEFLKNTTYFKNDKFGNVIEESANHSSETNIEVTIDMDLATNQSTSSVNNNSSSENFDKVTYEYKYDVKGNIIWSQRNGIGGTKIVKSFKYDDFGNLIEEIYYDENNIKIPQIKREYVYR